MSEQIEVQGRHAKPFMVSDLSMRNYRGFDLLEFGGWAGLNVLVGANGVGKSGILNGIALCLAKFAGGLLGQRPPLSLTRNDVRGGARNTEIRLTIGDEIAGSNFSYSAAFDVFTHPDLPRPYHGVEDHVAEYLLPMEGRPKCPLPVIAFYPVGRSVPQVSGKLGGVGTTSPAAAYQEAFSPDVGFKEFFHWFRQQEDIENERLVRGVPLADTPLNSIRMAIKVFMEGYGNLRIDRETTDVLLDKGGDVLNVNQLSDGEKGLLTLVGDIARRLAIANRDAQTNPLHGAGIVLIDEIDLHLHPTWQRKVIRLLPQVFPHIQFFLTSHSPVVAGSTPMGGLFLIEERQVKPQQFYGQDVALVLDELFDTPVRDEEIQRRLDSLIASIESGLAEESRKELHALEAQLGTKDPDLTRARTRMRGLGLL